MLRIVALLLALSLISRTAAGLDLDSLESRLRSLPKDDAERIEILNILARDLSYINIDRAFGYAKEALELSIRLKDKAGQAYAYRNLGSIYSQNENYFLATDFINKSLILFNQLKDSTGVGNCYITLGHTYRRLGNRALELKYHQKAYHLIKKSREADRIGVAAHNLGESYFNLGDLEQAFYYTQEAYEINDSIGNTPVLVACLKVLGKIRLAQGNLQDAERHFNEGLRLNERLGTRSQKIAGIESMIGIAEIHKQSGLMAMELETLRKAEAYAKANHLNKYLMQIYTSFIDFSTRAGDPVKVLSFIKTYRSVSDSLTQLQLQDRFSLTQNINDIFELELQNRELMQMNAVQTERLKVRTVALLALLGAAITLTLGTITITQKNKRLRETKQVLERQNALIQSQKDELQKLNSTKDKFFSIVAHDLKSPIASLHSFTTLMLEEPEGVTKEEVEMMRKELSGQIDNVGKLADNLITWASLQMKEFVFQPAAINVVALGEEMKAVYAPMAHAKNIEFKFNADECQVFGDVNHINLILRNLLSNAIKFTRPGGAVEFSIMKQEDRTVSLVVQDTGVGIPVNLKDKLLSLEKRKSTEGTAGEKGTGLGLMLCMEFVTINNGAIEIFSEEGVGTKIMVILPSA